MTELWTIEDIAAYYRRSVRHARRIVKTHGFPDPVRGDRGRWVSAQVKAWAEAGGGDERAEQDKALLHHTTAPGTRVKIGGLR